MTTSYTDACGPWAFSKVQKWEAALFHDLLWPYNYGCPCFFEYEFVQMIRLFDGFYRFYSFRTRVVIETSLGWLSCRIPPLERGFSSGVHLMFV